MKQFLLTLVGAAGLLGFTSPALCQPPVAHGHGDPIAVIESLKASLNLNTSQQQQWDSAVALSQTARQTAKTSFGQLKAALQAELAKAEPDLASLAAQADAVQEQNSAARKTARAAWLAMYATFTPDQKAVVREALQARIAQMEAFRARMKERLEQ